MKNKLKQLYYWFLFFKQWLWLRKTILKNGLWVVMDCYRSGIRLSFIEALSMFSGVSWSTYRKNGYFELKGTNTIWLIKVESIKYLVEQVENIKIRDEE